MINSSSWRIEWDVLVFHRHHWQQLKTTKTTTPATEYTEIVLTRRMVADLYNWCLRKWIIWLSCNSNAQEMRKKHSDHRSHLLVSPGHTASCTYISLGVTGPLFSIHLALFLPSQSCVWTFEVSSVCVMMDCFVTYVKLILMSGHKFLLDRCVLVKEEKKHRGKNEAKNYSHPWHCFFIIIIIIPPYSMLHDESRWSRWLSLCHLSTRSWDGIYSRMQMTKRWAKKSISITPSLSIANYWVIQQHQIQTMTRLFQAFSLPTPLHALLKAVCGIKTEKKKSHVTFCQHVTRASPR